MLGGAGRQGKTKTRKRCVCVGGGGVGWGGGLPRAHPVECLIDVASLARAASRRGLCGSGVRVGPGTDV